MLSSPTRLTQSNSKMKSDVERCLRGLNFGKLYFHNKEYETAERYVMDYLSVKPNSSEAYKLLAQINEAIGDHDKALQNYRKSLDIRKQNVDTYSFVPAVTHSNSTLNSTINSTMNSTLNSSSMIINNKPIVEKKDESVAHNSCANQNLLKSLSSQQESLIQTNKMIIDLLTKNNLKIDNIERKLSEMQDSLINLTDAQNVLKETLYDYVTHEHAFEDYVLDDKENDIIEGDDIEDGNNGNEWHSSAIQLENHLDNQKPLSELFKPPLDSWSCEMCLVQNSSSNKICVACETPNPNVISLKQSDNLFKLPETDTRPLQTNFNTNFSFGGFNTSSTINNTFSNNTFKFGNFSSSDLTPFNCLESTAILNKNDTNDCTTDLKPKPEVAFQFGMTREFNFKFPGVQNEELHKSPKSPKSPAALNCSTDAVEEDNSNLEHSEHNEHTDNIYFQPVIPLPPKIDVKTGEEEETILHSCRAKLFRFVNNEWKERGLGEVKILESPDSGRMRVVMRRDTVLKVCLNHYITPELKLELKEDFKSIQWSAVDYSEDPPKPEIFAMRFKNSEIAKCFLDAFERAQSMPEKEYDKIETINNSLNDDNDDELEIIYQKFPESEELKQKAIQLKLPINFFDYENKPPCPGCRGCTDYMPLDKSVNDVNVVNDVNHVNENPSEPTNQNDFSSIFSSAIAEYGKVNQTNQWNSKESNSWFTNTPAPIFANKEHNSENDEAILNPDIYFKPIIPLPDIIEVKTGEEEETILYSSRAKLFKFTNNEWKERGVGILKILQSPESGRVRLVMRRDAILKVCLNHYITPELNLELKEDLKSIQWSAVDYSEDSPTPEIFAMRFKNPEIAKSFLDAFENAQSMPNNNN